MIDPMHERALDELAFGPDRAYAVAYAEVACLLEAVSHELAHHAERALAEPGLWDWHAHMASVRSSLRGAMLTLFHSVPGMVTTFAGDELIRQRLDKRREEVLRKRAEGAANEGTPQSPGE
jgi:hypothetical protein